MRPIVDHWLSEFTRRNTLLAIFVALVAAAANLGVVAGGASANFSFKVNVGKCTAGQNISYTVVATATNDCGTFFMFMYLWIAVLVGVPRVWHMQSTFSCSTSWRTSSTVLGGE